MGSQEEVDLNLIHALHHPLRVKMLRVLSEQTASPKMMSQMFREPLGTVSYHADVLVKCGCIEEVMREPRRGAVEHFYRAKPSTSVGARSWQQVPAALKDDFVAMSLKSFSSRVIRALENGAFEEAEGSNFSWQAITVDQAGWREIQELLGEVDARLESVVNGSKRRLASDDGIPLVVVFGAIKAGSR